jgi:hypothetical protein
MAMTRSTTSPRAQANAGQPWTPCCASRSPGPALGWTPSPTGCPSWRRIRSAAGSASGIRYVGRCEEAALPQVSLSASGMRQGKTGGRQDAVNGWSVRGAAGLGRGGPFVEPL